MTFDFSRRGLFTAFAGLMLAPKAHAAAVSAVDPYDYKPSWRPKQPYTFTLQGQLPSGLTFNSVTGEISGTHP
jgi:hypothetical protein